MKGYRPGQSLEEAGRSHQRAWKNIVNVIREVYGFKSKEKPTSMKDFIEQKKHNEPFYKDKNKKPWE